MFPKRYITEFLQSYAASGTIRAHMPGHKGKCIQPFPENAYAWDITEIDGADSLFEADGILRDSERQTTAIWGSGDCCYSAGGSTLCIQAMLARMQAEGRTVIAARTVHRAFLNACALLDLEVRWIMPRAGGVICGSYAPADFGEALEAARRRGERTCVYVTSPDYTGQLMDLRALAAVCHACDAPLLVDNAHGAHLAFLPENRHPMALGADYCCDSFHKMLPSLTGAAVLHTRKPGQAAEMKQYMQLFGSTSPSYLILQSIEQAAVWAAQDGVACIRQAAEEAQTLRGALPGYRFLGQDPLHLSMACDGNAMAQALRGRGIECEYADKTCIVLLLSPMTENAQWQRIGDALREIRAEPAAEMPALPPLPERVCSIREGALHPWETVPLAKAPGRICGPVQVPCPPAVPVLVSGERITAEWASVLAFYGIRECAVMK